VTERTTILDRTRRVFEPAIRRVLHTYWRFSRGLTLGVRGLCIDESNRIFLVKHSYVTGWQLPGGGVERGETVLDALIRELAEEGNIEPTAPPIPHAMLRPGNCCSNWPMSKASTRTSPKSSRNRS
jgi:8-oxo-dGTP pyrophosphatase MutT (NUDIX family)